MRHITKFALAASLALAAASPSFAATMQCAPFQTVQAATATTYTADADGIVTGVGPNDVRSMEPAGCQLIGLSGYTLIGRIVGANMNSTSDQPATMFIPANSYYVPGAMIAKNCTTSLTTAAGAVYDASAKGGNRIYGSGTTQPFSGCTGAGTGQNIAQLTGAAVVDPATSPPILSLTTGQGSAATANVYFYGYVLGK
jgi:hypothetical protein